MNRDKRAKMWEDVRNQAAVHNGYKSWDNFVAGKDKFNNKHHVVSAAMLMWEDALMENPDIRRDNHE